MTVIGSRREGALLYFAAVPGASIGIMASLAWARDHPACLACGHDEIFDRSGRVRRAAVRVGMCREPYLMRLCERHLAQLTKMLPPGGVWIVERYEAS